MTSLADAREQAGDLLDHLEVRLPSVSDLPTPDIVRNWHEHLIQISRLQEAASNGPVRSVAITVDSIDRALVLAEVLDGFGATHPRSHGAAWLEPFRRAAVKGESDAWSKLIRKHMEDWASLDSERAQLAARSVELPEGLLESEDAKDAIKRAAVGERLWPVLSIGRGTAKTLVSAIKLDGAAVKDGDVQGWRHVAVMICHAARQREASSRWQTIAVEIGAPGGAQSKAAIDVARAVLRAADKVHAHRSFLSAIVSNALTLEALHDDPERCGRLAAQIRAAAGALQLSSVRAHIDRTLERFQQGEERTSAVVRQLLEEAIGNPNVPPERIEQAWRSILQRVSDIRARASAFEAIVAVTGQIEAAGAPQWANRLRTEPPEGREWPLRSGWRDAWDHAAADRKLKAIDARERLAALTHERADADRQSRKLFSELVRERTFYELDRRLSPSVKSALVEFVRALARIGKGTGKGAGHHRAAAREAMSRCYDAVPCWIMPTWRVAEQLPSELGVLDLVIIDEASQSDVTELPALLRGRKILVVGDDRQVSPTAPFVTQAKVAQLRHHYLDGLPFKNLLEPGESIYDLMRAVFPNDRLMLKEHFRCVEPIIQFSMQFYPEKMIPLRIPTAQERLDPPLVDIYVPHGTRDKRQKINRVEADIIVKEIEALTKTSSMAKRSIGVISLIGSEQAEFIRAKLSEAIGEELMQRHAILCGDSATFQGTERDIVFLSMVADPVHRTALTMLRYEQRFNVAVSRARDRVILVRSVRREELHPDDLKARLIAHFESPMPLQSESGGQGLEACESGFERDLMKSVLDRGYRVRAQVGSLGFRIDMVVEGAGGRRLAVECDGDRFHGPEQWQEDMRRQRVLERVGWRFWRCFASSFYRDADYTIRDLVETLSRMGIEPIGAADAAPTMARYTEHRIVAQGSEAIAQPRLEEVSVLKGKRPSASTADELPARGGISIGDKIVLRFADDKRTISVRLTEAANDLDKGLLSCLSPMGRAMMGAEEGDEIEFQTDDGRKRRALIESVEKPRASRDDILSADETGLMTSAA
jgi:transcription elongation GreA/GreB family factor/very-short-patch-repair endonuclease